jgi:cobalt-zinc-cadmium efflux system outer membrane protein
MAQLAPSEVSLPQKLDLDQALEIFHARGFDLLLAEANVGMAHGDVAAAGAVPNPVVGMAIGHAGGHYHPSQCGSSGCSATAYSGNISEQGALADVVSGKRGLRIEVAQAALQAARMGREDARRTLDIVLKGQYLAVAIDAANLRFLINVQQSFANTYDLFAARYAAGDISEADLVRMETVALEAEQNVDAAEQQVRLDKVSLAFLLGVRGQPPEFETQAIWLEDIANKAWAEVPQQQWLELALQRRPDLQAQRASRERAAASVRLGRRSRVPDLQLSFAYTQQGNGENALQPPTYTGGLNLTLPAFYQYQGEVQRALADLAMQTTAYAKMEGQIMADVGQAYNSVASGYKRLQRMQTKLRARAARALELVQLQYEKGAASLLDLLDAQRTFIAINQAYIGDLSAFWQALFELEGAVAMELKR